MKYNDVWQNSFWEMESRKKDTYSSRLEADSSWVESDTLSNKCKWGSGFIRGTFVVTILNDGI